MTRTLIVYYSMTGAARRVAELLEQLTQWPTLEVFDTPEHPLADDARPAAAYQLHGPDTAEFDRLVVITPVWLGELAPPLRSLLRDTFQTCHTLRVKQVSLICVVGLDGAAGAIAEVARLVDRPLLRVVTLSHDDVLDGTCMRALQDLSEAVCSLDAACATAPLT